jgi:hypothetical protein
MSDGEIKVLVNLSTRLSIASSVSSCPTSPENSLPDKSQMPSTDFWLELPLNLFFFVADGTNVVTLFTAVIYEWSLLEWLPLLIYLCGKLVRLFKLVESGLP